VSTAGALQAIDASLDYLSKIVSAQKNSSRPDFDRLLIAYVETRRELAKNFRELARSVLLRASERMNETRAEIATHMRSQFAGVVPDRLLQVRGYATVHALLLEYLASHRGKPVAASRLRVLVGDQVHTERRVRELRDLGFAVTWKRVAGEDQYVLDSTDPDLDQAARSQLALNIRADKQLSKDARASFLELTRT
jgi:hypothetical protein